MATSGQNVAQETMFTLAEEGDVGEFKKHLSKVDLLKDRDINGGTYLHRALSKAEGDNGYLILNLINFLLSKAPQLTEVKNLIGETPISLACKKNLCAPIIKRLVQCTCASDIETEIQIIQVAVESGCNFTIIELLMNKFTRFNINTKYEEGVTLLLKYGKSYYNVNKLLSYGADPNIVDNCGRSALYFATENEDPDAIKCLIESGADPLAKIVVGSSFSNSNNPCNIITKVFQLAIHTNSNSYDSDLDSTEFTNENDKWLDLFDFILNLTSLKDKPISDTYIQLLKDMYWYFYVGEELESVVKKALVVITVNNNKNVHNIIEFLPKYRKFQEIDIKVDLVAFMLAHISQESFKARSHSRVDEFINLMFKVGFSVDKCPDNQPTALTALLAYPEEESPLYSFARKYIVDKLIEKSVNVESMALSTATQYFQIHYGSELHSYKMKLYLPDSVVLALDTNQEVLTVLLPYWWGPPLLLLIFHSKLQNVEVRDPEELNETLALVHEDVFLPLMPFLSNYGGIPHGTEMFKIALSLFVLWNDLAAKTPYEENFSVHYQAFKQLTSSPLSLQELCKYAVRGSFAERASHSTISLPKLLHEALPPLLRPVVLH